MVGVEPVGRAAEGIVEQFAEAVEMVTRDTEIHVVVPGDKAAVTDGAEHGAAQHVVGDGVLSADAIEDGGHVEQQAVAFVDVDRSHGRDVDGAFMHCR